MNGIHEVTGSIPVSSTNLPNNLATGFEGLWRKAMRDLREIDFHPGPHRA